ncbi:MAG: LCP family protein [Bacteroidetes bacterium]|nr:LCP family protein [Bacteroidota bacterium]
MNTQESTETEKPRRKRRWLWYLGFGVLGLMVWQVVSWLTPVPTPLATAAAVTDKAYEVVFDESIKKRAAELPPEVNILLVGLDNRLASHDNHADAIHLITIRTKDSIGAVITSVPRGTEAPGYGIEDDLAFMANVRALRGRNTFIKAISKLTGKKINYYVEVSFSQVMGVLELLGYKDPATALQFLRHRKSYPLGDVQRSYNQGKFIRTQLIRRADLLTGAKGDLMLRMGLGMVDTDIDFNTAQALVYVLKNGNALDSAHITQTMRPRINLERVDGVEIPEPDQMAAVVNNLVRRTGEQIDDLGRYNPYPRLNEILHHAEAQQKNDRAVLAIMEPVYEQKAWLQVQERPQRQELRNRVEHLMVNAYNGTKKPDKAAEVKKYLDEERQAFHDVERETRQFAYGRRNVPPHHAKAQPLDSVAAARARQDDIHQKQTHVEPQEPSTTQVGDDAGNGEGAQGNNGQAVHDVTSPQQEGGKHVEPKAQDSKTSEPKAAEPKASEPKVQDVKSADGAQAKPKTSAKQQAPAKLQTPAKQQKPKGDELRVYDVKHKDG